MAAWQLLRGHQSLIQRVGFLSDGSPAKKLFRSSATGLSKLFAHVPVRHQAIDGSR